MVESGLSKMTDEQRQHFEYEFMQHKKDSTVMLVLAIFFPIQLFFLKKAGLGVLYWLTFWGLGLWWLIEIFMTPKRTRLYNYKLAIDLYEHVKRMGPPIVEDAPHPEPIQDSYRGGNARLNNDDWGDFRKSDTRSDDYQQYREY